MAKDLSSGPLATWTRRLDLLVKLAGVLAVIGALNLFVAKPDVSIGETCSRLIDLRRLSETLKGRPLLKKLRPEVRAYNATQLQVFGPSSCLLAAPFSAQIPSYNWFSDEPLQAFFGDVDASQALFVGPDQTLAFRVLSLAPPSEATTTLEALDQSAILRVRVTTSNEGSGTSSQVLVVPPEELDAEAEQDLTFELPPGETRSVTFRSTRPSYRGGIQVDWDRSEVVNRVLLVGVAIAFLLFWLIIVVWDRTRRQETLTPGEERTE